MDFKASKLSQLGQCPLMGGVHLWEVSVSGGSTIVAKYNLENFVFRCVNSGHSATIWIGFNPLLSMKGQY